MTNRRPWIKTLRPLVLPGLLVILIVVLTIMLKSLAPLDRALIAAVGLIPASLQTQFGYIANLGSVPVIIAIVFSFSVYELSQRHWVRAMVMVMSLLAVPAFLLLKLVVHRARPVTDYVTAHGLHDFSFPSGHSTASAAVYGMVIILLWSAPNRLLRNSAIVAASAIIFLVGLSRVYLGAHYPTDVFGGWLLALIILSLLRSLSLAIAKRSSRPAREAVIDTTEGATQPKA